MSESQPAAATANTKSPLILNNKHNTSYSSMANANMPIIRHRISCNPADDTADDDDVDDADDLSFQSDETVCTSNSPQDINKIKVLLQKSKDALRPYSTSLYLENKTGVARDHLANERTFLAWIRTSLSNMTVGIGMAQLFRLNKQHGDDVNSFIGKCVGTVFISMGIIYLIFACMRYFHSQESLTKGKFPSSRSIILCSSTMTFCAVLAVFIIIAKKYYV